MGRRPRRDRPAPAIDLRRYLTLTVTVLVTAEPPLGFQATLTASLPLRETLIFSAAVPACLTVLASIHRRSSRFRPVVNEE